MSFGKNIVVRDFMFCEEHGFEYCGYCCCDHRLCNNIRLEEYVEQYNDQDTAIEAMEALDSQERQPLNVFAFGERTRRKRDGEPVFKCYKHKTDDCNVCFDFVRHLLEREGFYKDLDEQSDDDSDAGDDSDPEDDFRGPPSLVDVFAGVRLDQPPPLVDVFANEDPRPARSAPGPAGTQAPQSTANSERIFIVPKIERPKPSQALRDAASRNPLLRIDHHVITKNRRVHDGQRPTNASVVRAMTSPDCPRRFIPPSPDSRPTDLFYERPDFSMNAFPRLFHRQDDRTILFYTDGACLDQDGGASGRRRAGCAFVYCNSKPGMKLALEGTVGGAEQTSNRAELRAVLFFLQMRHWEAGGADRIVVATDSEYVVEGACVLLDTWAQRGWKTARGAQVKNRDLWEALLHEIQLCEAADLQLLFWRIPRAWNERTDRLAKEAADMRDRDETPSVVIGILM